MVAPRSRVVALRSGGIALLAVVVLAARPTGDAREDDPALEQIDRLVADRCRAGDPIELIGEREIAGGDRCILLRHREGGGEFGAAGEVAMLVRLERLRIWIAYFAVAGEAPPPLDPSSLSDPARLASWRSSPRVRAVPIPAEEATPLDEGIAIWLATRRAEQVMPPLPRTEEPRAGR